jgi:hypothetical protein
MEPLESVGGRRSEEDQMRTLRAITTAAAMIITTLFFAQAANADRLCKQRCEGGVCEQRVIGAASYNKRQGRDLCLRVGSHRMAIAKG